MIQKSKKIVLTGHFNVGKTSLIKKFVHSIFSDEYLSTIGVIIEKKEVKIGAFNYYPGIYKDKEDDQIKGFKETEGNFLARDWTLHYWNVPLRSIHG